MTVRTTTYSRSKREHFVSNPQMKKVDILLSTYNGECFLTQLLDSLFKQTYSHWRLIVRDDGSTDNTLHIINDFKQKYPEKVFLINDHTGNMGACLSFSRLLSFSLSEYTMFCDQDDVWLPQKIEVTLDRMLTVEKEYDNSGVLIHSNLKVVDQDLKLIADSFWDYQNLNPTNRQLHSLLVQNNVTASTVMINKILKDALLPIPPEAIMHDWWLALFASCFGVIDYLEQPTVLYRQHSSNDTGAKKYSFLKVIQRLFEFRNMLESINKITKQGKSFYEQYGNLLTTPSKEVVFHFATLLQQNNFERLTSLLRYNYKKTGFFRNLAFIILILLKAKS